MACVLITDVNVCSVAFHSREMNSVVVRCGYGASCHVIQIDTSCKGLVMMMVLFMGCYMIALSSIHDAHTCTRSLL